MEKTKTTSPYRVILNQIQNEKNILNHISKNLILQNILEYLKLGPQNRRDICNFLDLPWTTAYDYLNELKKSNLVIKYRDPNHKGRGRSNTLWALKPKEE